MTEDRAQELALVALATTQVLIETMDQLKDTQFYKQKVAQTLNQSQKVLIGLCNQHYDTTWKLDAPMMNGMEMGVEEIIKEVASLHPARLAMIAKIIQSTDIPKE